MSGKPARWREWNPWSSATCCWPSILISPPEVRLYLARQAWEEANHAMAFEYVIKTLPVDRERVFGMMEEHPAVAAKAAFQRRLTAEILRPDLDLATIEGRQRLLRNLGGLDRPGASRR
jgi:ribonucleoside-diphosphate reductase beta chain